MENKPIEMSTGTQLVKSRQSPLHRNAAIILFNNNRGTNGNKIQTRDQTEIMAQQQTRNVALKSTANHALTESIIRSSPFS